MTVDATVVRIPTRGPFSLAELVVVRACGLADVLPLQEPRSRAAVARLYGRPEPMGDAEYLQLAEAWRPFRTWVAVLARAAGERVVPAGGAVAPAPGERRRVTSGALRPRRAGRPGGPARAGV